MPPLKHTDKEHILPVKMAVIGEKNAREYPLPKY